MTSPLEPPFVRPRVAAGVLFLAETDRVLLVVPSYKDFLDLPGGCVEPGESPRVAAQREVREELAIEPPVGRLLVADWWSDSPDGVGGAKLLFVFEGGYLTPAQLDNVTVDGDEVVGYRFHALTDLDTVTTPPARQPHPPRRRRPPRRNDPLPRRRPARRHGSRCWALSLVRDRPCRGRSGCTWAQPRNRGRTWLLTDQTRTRIQLGGGVRPWRAD